MMVFGSVERKSAGEGHNNRGYSNVALREAAQSDPSQENASSNEDLFS